jgi:arylsulfatase
VLARRKVVEKNMKRRSFLKNSLAITATGAILSQCTSSRTLESERPSIIIIHTDQHRIDCLGASGNKQIKTPNIDAIAADGVLYNNSYCSYPVCTPSRYSLLTGLYVREHGGYSNHCTLRPEVDTFPSMLKEVGYKTKAVGKMHFTPTYFDVGFTEMELAEQNGPGRWDDDYHRDLRENDLVDHNDLEDQLREYRKQAPESYFMTYGARASNLPDKYHSITWIGDKAVETIESWEKDEPNLLMVGFVKPHHPFDPPQKWIDMYDEKEIEILPGWTDECFEHDQARSKGYFPHAELTKETVKKATAYYYASITHIDHHVGRMIDLLKKNKMYDKTLIIFTSDHGEYLGFHHMLLKGNYMYDPLGKVPLVIKYPGNANKGQERDDLVSNIDLAPTILNSVNLKPSSRMSGENLGNATLSRKILIAENGRNTIMARSDTMKLIVNMKNNSSIGGLLYDLGKDPLELINLYDNPEYDSHRSQLLSAIESWLNSTTPQELYQNQDAPQISQSNVPPLDLSHRSDMIEYFKEKMQGASE